MKRFVVGDIHGALKALKQCIERSGADIEKDEFIFLGDVTDGWPETKQCVDFIMSLKNFEYILGNHDEWTLEWMVNGTAEELWTKQGGQATIDSYGSYVPFDHKEFFKKASLFLHYEDDLFVHAGIDSHTKAEDNKRNVLLWERGLAQTSKNCVVFPESDLARPHYKRIFIGHTPMSFDKPMFGGRVWNLDTGAGWGGKLTIMNIDTEEFWQSDVVETLYPDFKGRGK